MNVYKCINCGSEWRRKICGDCGSPMVEILLITKSEEIENFCNDLKTSKDRLK